MTTMRSMNPDAPNFVDASGAAARYANFVNEPKYQVANAYFDKLDKEKLANELKAEEFRRYNQEFGLKQAAANREQSKYDRELNTNKALIDFQNQIGRASAGGAMNDQQGAQLADEYNRLLKTAGEDEAARIINEKAQKFGAQDAKRAESDPYYRAELIKGVALPSGNIDPKSLIDLRNSQITRNETLGQRKDDLETRAKEREEDLWFKKQELAMRQAERNERAREKLDAKKAVAELVGLSMNEDQNRSSSGAYYNVNQVNTGNKILKDDVSIPDGEGSKELSEMDEITNKINSLYGKNLNKDGKQINFANKDEAFKAYMEENPEAANSNAAIKGIDRSLKGASNLASATIKNMFLPSEGLGKAFDKSKQIFMSDVEREEYNKKLDEAKAKEAQESLKSNDKDDKAKSGNISFEDYWSLKKQQQTLDNAELGKLQEELGKKSLTYSDNLANKYGVDEIKSAPKEMTPHEARIYATKNTVKSLIERGVSEENALKLGLEEGEKAFKFQTNYINNVNENSKETAKNRYTEVKEERKALQDQIKTLESRKFDIGKSKESKIVYNGQKVKLSEVQDGLDNEISRLKKELANLK
jgi:hypothetical protein